jgi:hypothetical protein
MSFVVAHLAFWHGFQILSPLNAEAGRLQEVHLSAFWENL